MDTPRKTPLHARHVALGARMVDFAGWHMPVQYDGVIKEHTRVRTRVGVFDVSHMGELWFVGPGAEATLDHLATNDVRRMRDGQALYTALCNERGGVRDDALVYRLDEACYMLVVNAANTAKILEWSRAHLQPDTQLEDRSAATALIAVQGPRSRDVVLAGLPDWPDLETALADLAYYRFLVAPGRDAAQPARILSRTGYTGELGYEIYLPAADALAVWDRLLERAGAVGGGPAGLAARDTLRFEVGYCLYGHELDEDITPLEAGIGWTVKWKKPDFIGKAALEAQRREGVPRRLVGLEISQRAIARQGYEVLRSGRVVGRVTSGTFAPTLQRSLAMALVERAASEAALAVRIRNREVPAERVPLPFYKPE